MELGLDPASLDTGGMGGADDVGSGVDVAVVEKVARQNAAFRPPFVAVDEQVGRIARRRLHQVGRFHQLVGRDA